MFPTSLTINHHDLVLRNDEDEDDDDNLITMNSLYTKNNHNNLINNHYHHENNNLDEKEIDIATVVSSSSKSSSTTETENENNYFFKDNLHSKETMKMLNILRKNRQLCDLILQIDDNNKDIYCHQLILACNSKFFMEIFLNMEYENKNENNGNGIKSSSNPSSPKHDENIAPASIDNHQLQQQSSNDSNGENARKNSQILNNHNISKQIQFQLKNYLNNINEHTYIALKACIDYMYTSKLILANKNLIQDIYLIAHKLDFEAIIQICSKYLIENLNIKNCLKIRSFALDENLIQYSTQFIEKTINELKFAKEFLDLPCINIELIGINNHIQEIVINELILKWLLKYLNIIKLELPRKNSTNNLCGSVNGNGSGASGGSGLFSSSRYELIKNNENINTNLNDLINNLNLLYLNNDDKCLHDCFDMELTNFNYSNYIHDYIYSNNKIKQRLQNKTSNSTSPPSTPSILLNANDVAMSNQSDCPSLDNNNGCKKSNLPKLAIFKLTNQEMNEYYQVPLNEPLLHDNEIICTHKLDETNYLIICIINGRVLKLSIHLLNENIFENDDELNQEQNQKETNSLTNGSSLTNGNSTTLPTSNGSDGGVCNGGDNKSQPMEFNELINNAIPNLSRSNSLIDSQVMANNIPTNGNVSSINNEKKLAKMQSARCSHGIISYENCLYIVAGYDRGECLNKFSIYDPKLNETKQLEPLKNKRGRAATVYYAKTNSIYVLGGSDGHEDLYSSECFNLTTKQWSLVNFDVSFQCSNIGCICDDEFIYLVGIQDQLNSIQTHCLKYDPEINKFFSISSLNIERTQCALVRSKEFLYVFGGHDQIRCLNTCEAYNIKENKWKIIASMIEPRRGCGAAVRADFVYIVGGTNGSCSLKTMEIYNISTNKFTIGPELNVARANVAIAFLGNFLFAVGGFDGKSFLRTMEYLDVNDLESGWSIYHKNFELS